MNFRNLPVAALILYAILRLRLCQLFRFVSISSFASLDSRLRKSKPRMTEHLAGTPA
jgi:hypothetical protein